MSKPKTDLEKAIEDAEAGIRAGEYTGYDFITFFYPDGSLREEITDEERQEVYDYIESKLKDEVL